MNFFPVMVRLKPDGLTVNLERLVMEGTGLLTDRVFTLELPPPGVGLLTRML